MKVVWVSILTMLATAVSLGGCSGDDSDGAAAGGAAGAAGGSAGTGGTAGTGGSAGTGGTAGTGGDGGSGAVGGTGGSGGQAGTGGAGGSTTDPVDEFTAQAAHAICSALFRCCDAASMETYFSAYASNSILADLGYADKLPPKAPLADEASCAALVEEMLDIVPFGDWVAQVKAGKVEYDQAATESCTKTLDEAECGTELAAALFDARCFGFQAPTAPDKRSMFTRHEGVGTQGCVPIRDGVGASFFGTCDPTVAFCCFDDPNTPGQCGFPFDSQSQPRQGTCKAVSEEGGACKPSPSIQLCKTGLSCDSGSATCVASGTAVLHVGDECIDDNFNLLGDCEASWCDMLGSSKCEPLKNEGDNCQAGYECASGACDSSKCTPFTFCTNP